MASRREGSSKVGCWDIEEGASGVERGRRFWWEAAGGTGWLGVGGFQDLVLPPLLSPGAGGVS